MIVVPAEVHRAAFAHGVMRDLGAVRVASTRALPQPAGFTSISPDAAEIDEWAVGAEVVARKVVACGHRMHWLRHDIATLAEAALEREHAEMERVRDGVVQSIMQDRQRRGAAPPAPLPSPQLIHAAMKHSARIGRLHDQNSRGDAERAKFAHLLARLETEKEPS
jgi:hypothetical protein